MINRLDVYNALYATKLVPLFYHPDIQRANVVVEACLAGGANIIEFTNRGPQALSVFNELRQQYTGTELVLGIGSVMDAPTAALYLAHGADFIVSPIFNPEVAMLCNRRKVAYLPGCATPSEISEAESYGSEVVKLFPANTAGGPAFVKAVLAPSPWTSLMVTGGVKAEKENILAWFESGVKVVGMGSQLISNDKNPSTIQATVAQVLGWIDAYHQ